MASSGAAGDPAGAVPEFRRIARDLILLPLRVGERSLINEFALDWALMAVELIELVDAGRITIITRRARLIAPHLIRIDAPLPTGVPELDAHLRGLLGRRQPVGLETWIWRPRPGIGEGYFALLAAVGAVVAGPPRPGMRDWFLGGTGPAARAGALARLDAIARGAGPVDPGQATFGGLAYACGIGRRIYQRDSYPRDRLKRIAAGEFLLPAPGQERLAGAVAATISAVRSRATFMD